MTDKVVVITGGSRGIGRATAIAAAARGFRVCVGYASNEAAARQVVAAIEGRNGKAIAVKCDVGDERDILAMFKAADGFGTLGALVNNAGIVGTTSRVDEMSAERIQRMMAVNVTGSILCAREAVKRMSTRHGGQGGVIVNLSSVAAKLGSPNTYVDYAASKGAIDSFTIGLGHEVAGEGIRVAAIRPGLIDTEIHASGGDPDRAQRLATCRADEARRHRGRNRQRHRLADVGRCLLRDISHSRRIGRALIPVTRSSYRTSIMASYDLVIIGTGPGGYVCAVRAAQLGMKVAVVEKNATLGGTCLNVGCMPSKALLHASEMFEEAGHSFAKMGISVSAPKLDLPAMMNFKQQGIDGNVKGVEFLMKKNKIDVISGKGKVLGSGKVEVTGGDGKTQVVETKNIVIATGSDIARLKGIEIDEKRIVSSTGALSLDKVPASLLIVGAGVIGLELGSVWHRLGAKVTVVEFLDRILPGMDGEVAKQFQRILEKQGFAFKLGAKVTGVDTSGKTLSASVEPAAGGAAETLEADVVLVCIGRVPYTEGLGLKEAGVALDNRGRVQIDAHFATSVKGVYAIGDVVAGPMLAHKAEDEGVACAEILAGQAGHVNYDVIPGVVYTTPEVSAVGKTEEELKEAGVAYTVGKFPFTANGRSKVNQTTEGFVKVLADAKTDRVLGVHIIGREAGEMIHEAAVLMEFGGSAEDLARTCHAHPTRSEAIKEAALAVGKRAIHM